MSIPIFSYILLQPLPPLTKNPWIHLNLDPKWLRLYIQGNAFSFPFYLSCGKNQVIALHCPFIPSRDNRFSGRNEFSLIISVLRTVNSFYNSLRHSRTQVLMYERIHQFSFREDLLTQKFLRTNILRNDPSKCYKSYNRKRYVKKPVFLQLHFFCTLSKVFDKFPPPPLLVISNISGN